MNLDEGWGGAFELPSVQNWPLPLLVGLATSSFLGLLLLPLPKKGVKLPRPSPC